MTPDITINVDPTNPGQFFACCGLLEIAHRLTGHAEGWFGDGVFHVRSACGIGLKDIGMALAKGFRGSVPEAELREFNRLNTTKKKELTASQVERKAELKLKFEQEVIRPQSVPNLVLDWWTYKDANGHLFKTWGGQQRTTTILTNLVSLAKGRPRIFDTNMLEFCVRSSAPPLYFDSEVAAQSSSVDVGYSLDALGDTARTRIDCAIRPCIELLAFVGLQRFRPVERVAPFSYFTWANPAQPSVAQAAMADSSIVEHNGRFGFHLLFRTEYLKAFLPATVTHP